LDVSLDICFRLHFFWTLFVWAKIGCEAERADENGLLPLVVFYTSLCDVLFLYISLCDVLFVKCIVDNSFWRFLLLFDVSFFWKEKLDVKRQEQKKIDAEKAKTMLQVSFTWKHIYTYITQIYVYIHKYIFTYTCMYIFTYLCVHIYTNIDTHTSVYNKVYIHCWQMHIVVCKNVHTEFFLSARSALLCVSRGLFIAFLLESNSARVYRALMSAYRLFMRVCRARVSR